MPSCLICGRVHVCDVLGGLSSHRRGQCSLLHPVQWSPCCGPQGRGRAGHGCDAVATRPLLPRTTTTSCTRGSTTRGTSWSCRRGSSSGECRALTAPGWGQGWGWAEAGATAARGKRWGRGTGTAFAMDRAAKQRRKGDRIVIDCQEQAYWLVNRPPVRPRALAPRTAMGAGAGGWWCWWGVPHGGGGPSSPGTLLSLQPGAPSVLEQGPERRNCHTSRVQLVGAGWSCPGGVVAVPLFWGDGEPQLC